MIFRKRFHLIAVALFINILRVIFFSNYKVITTKQSGNTITTLSENKKFEYTATKNITSEYHDQIIIKDSLHDNHDHENIKKKTLAHFTSEQKGVILFYHVSRTGGTSVRTLFQQVHDTESYNTEYLAFHASLTPKQIPENFTASDSCPMLPKATEYPKWRNFKNKITNALTHTGQKGIMLEIHGGTPGLLDLESDIRQWRRLSVENNIPFFAFTIIREPVSFAKSYFNFFYIRCIWQWCETGDDGRRYNLMRARKKDFYRHLIPNRQCFFLRHASAVNGMKHHVYNDCPATTHTCEEVYDSMIENLDWVGITENLSQDTMPMLSLILTGSTDLAETISPQNRASEEKKAYTLTDVNHKKTRRYLKEDQKIYENVVRDFPSSMWQNLSPG